MNLWGITDGYSSNSSLLSTLKKNNNIPCILKHSRKWALGLPMLKTALLSPSFPGCRDNQLWGFTERLQLSSGWGGDTRWLYVTVPPSNQSRNPWQPLLTANFLFIPVASKTLSLYITRVHISMMTLVPINVKHCGAARCRTKYYISVFVSYWMNLI